MNQIIVKSFSFVFFLDLLNVYDLYIQLKEVMKTSLRIMLTL